VPINPRVSISDREKLKQFSACYKVPPGLPCEETRERPWDAKFRFAIAAHGSRDLPARTGKAATAYKRHRMRRLGTQGVI